MNEQEIEPVKTHTGEKPNTCNQCNYASPHASHLRLHLITHSGGKSIKCSQCDYASINPSNLRRHLKIHTGKKLNKCIPWARQVYDTFENALEESLYDQWKTFENTHNMKIHLLCMWMWILISWINAPFTLFSCSLRRGEKSHLVVFYY